MSGIEDGLGATGHIRPGGDGLDLFVAEGADLRRGDDAVAAQRRDSDAAAAQQGDEVLGHVVGIGRGHAHAPDREGSAGLDEGQ